MAPVKEQAEAYAAKAGIIKFHYVENNLHLRGYTGGKLLVLNGVDVKKLESVLFEADTRGISVSEGEA